MEPSVDQHKREPGESQRIVGSRNEGVPHRVSRLQSFRRSIAKIVKLWLHVERNNIKASEKKTAKVYDILDCGPRHRFTVNGLLVSNCADILGGKVSDKAIDLAVRKAKENGEAVRMDEALDAAETEVQAAEKAEAMRRARLTARAKWEAQNIDPFDTFQIQPSRDRGWDKNRKLSEKQIAMLAKQGIDASKMPFAQGKQLINELFRRWDSNLCSFKQAKLLRKYDLPVNVTRPVASALIDAVKTAGWRRPANAEAILAGSMAPRNRPAELVEVGGLPW